MITDYGKPRNWQSKESHNQNPDFYIIIYYIIYIYIYIYIYILELQQIFASSGYPETSQVFEYPSCYPEHLHVFAHAQLTLTYSITLVLMVGHHQISKKEAALSFLLGDQQDDSVYEDELECFLR